VKQVNGENQHFMVFPLLSNMNFLGYMMIGQKKFPDQHSEEIIKNGIRALSLAAHNKNTLQNFQKRKDIQLIESVFQGSYVDISSSDFYIELKKVRCIFQVQSSTPESLQLNLQMFSELLIENETNSRLWIYHKKIVGLIDSMISQEKVMKILTDFPQVRIGVSAIREVRDIKTIHTMYQQSLIALTHC
jgi:purine catabolism regulator